MKLSRESPALFGCFALQSKASFAKGPHGQGLASGKGLANQTISRPLMKKIIPGTFFVAVLLMTGWFVGCHSFSTLKDSPDSASGLPQVSIKSNRVSGLVYYLPKGRIRITGDFKSGAEGAGPSAATKPSTPPGRARLRAAVAGAPSDGDLAEQ